MIFLLDTILIYEHQFGNEGTHLYLGVLIQIRNIPNNKIASIEGDRVPFFRQTAEIVIKTDQFRKHKIPSRLSR